MFIFPSAINASASNAAYSWYCNRVGNNAQPPLPQEFSFITDYDALWIDNTAKDEDIKKTIYLTFDAGYENGNVEKILNVLKDKGVHGAFFILINLIEKNPELVRRMADEGHAVCNHTARHKDMSKITDFKTFEKELNELSIAYRSLTGENISMYYRPPEGRFTELNLRHAKELGYKTVFWSFAYADWNNNNQPSAEFAKKKILANVHNGAVILLHPTSATNAAILGDIIDEMRGLGYEFGTLDDLSQKTKNS